MAVGNKQTIAGPLPLPRSRPSRRRRCRHREPLTFPAGPSLPDESDSRFFLGRARGQEGAGIRIFRIMPLFIH